MILDSNIKPFVLNAEATLREALQRITANASQFVLLVAPNGRLEGVLTDGDVRKWLMRQKHIDVDTPVTEIMNRTFSVAPINSSPHKIEELFSHRIKFVPLVDAAGKLTAIARPRSKNLLIDTFDIHEQSRVFIIAEIGNNHNGDIKLAKRLVDEAVAAGADSIKFQMRDLPSLHRNKGSAHDARADLGDQYTLDLLTRFQLPKKAYSEIFDYVKQKGALPLCTPFDEASVDALESYGVAAYKVASADLTNHPLLEKIARTGKPILCSTGMSTEDEVRAAVTIFRNLGAQYALLHCNSTYPAPLKDINLNYIDRLREIGDSIVGYSGHELGIYAVLGAVSKGAKIIEKHFTLDRTMEGNDHRVSLLPDEFRQMVLAVRDIEQALGSSHPRVVTQGEKMNREILGKSLVINTNLKEGETIEEHMIEIKSPGQGLPPYRKKELVGRRARRAFKAGDFFFPQDILGGSALPHTYHFDRPFGIPVRYHDFAAVHQQTNIDLVEFHFSYKDLEESPEKYLKGTYAIDFVVHAPELFAGDHILDLCSQNETYRKRSVKELQRVIDITRSLKKFFPRTKVPKIVVNVGGSSDRGHVSKKERAKLYKTLDTSLRALDTKGVELIPQTMPPFPWHFGGQRYHNVLVDPAEIASFCKAHGMRICLDISHSALAATHYQWSFADFVRTVSPYIAHLHIVDAAGVDSEGLQIGEGSIDFKLLAEILRAYAPQASFIPEIWQGHKNNGEGFWIALDRLEEFFGATKHTTPTKRTLTKKKAAKKTNGSRTLRRGARATLRRARGNGVLRR